MSREFPWGENLDALTQPGWEMDPVPRDKTSHPPRYGNFKEWFVGGIGEGFPQRGGRHRLTSEDNKAKQCVDLFLREPKLGTLQDLVIFGKDSGV